MTIETRRWYFAIGCAAIITIIGIIVAEQGWMESLEHRSYHARFLLRPQRSLHQAVRIVAIARRDRTIIGEPWPWPRNIHAQMIQILSHYQVATCAWDIIFLEPREGDDALTTIVSQTPHCVLGFIFQIERGLSGPPRKGLHLADFAIRPEKPGDEHLYTGAEVQWPISGLEQPGKLGFLNIEEELGGVIIRAPLVMRSQGYIFPSLSLLAVCHYLGVKPSAIVVKPGRWIRLASSKYGLFSIPIDERGRALINFYGKTSTLEKACVHYADVLASVQQALSGEKPLINLEEFKDKIVFVGATDPLLKDLCTTPIETYFPRVGIHATIASNILERNFIVRATPAMNRPILLILTFLVAGVTAWRPLRAGQLLAPVIFVMYLLAAHMAFALLGLWINVAAPAVCMVTAYSAVVTYRFLLEEREKARTRQLLMRYLSPEIVEDVLQRPEELVFTGETKKVTVILSDIRDFTPMTQEIGPQMVVSLLNEYFTAMTRVIHKYGGSVNQFVGDEILAAFGAPITRPDDALRAVKAALEMEAELEILMARWADAGRRTFDIGIGINTGEVVVGNIGSLEHMDYALIGDTVNYAARLESLTKELKARILISESTYQEVKHLVIAECLGPIRVKGRKEAENIYKLIRLKKQDATVDM